jgi:MFS transporter, FHS family, glucose/mannose:H+ symporter
MNTQYRSVFASACLGMLLFGIMVTTLGSILPEIIQRYGISKTDAGSLFLVMNCGILTGSLIFGPIVDRFGYKNLLVICTALLFAGIEGVAFAPTFEMFSLFVFLFGFSGGAINGAVNAVVSDISGNGRSAGLAFLGAFFGLGAFGVPILLGLLLDSFTYTQVMASIGGIVVLALFIFLKVDFPAPKQPHGLPFKEMGGLLRDPTLLLLGFMLFFQSGVEITTGGWAATYFNDVLG